ncbi:MAG: ABC transporter ATP-binding protein [Candidatus Kariarchaeaceae archaeon]|jgi:ABC-type multidrug transport system fused ATPase/permease subunit
MAFVMAGLDKSDYDREYSDKELIKRIIGYFRPYKFHMLIAVIVISLGAFAAALIPVYISDVLNGLDEEIPSSEIQYLVILVLGMAILNFTFNAISQEITARAVQGTIVNLRRDAFDALLERDMAFFDDQPIGRLASRVSNDTNDFGQIVLMASQFLGQLVVLFFISAILIQRSLKLMILITLFVPVIIYATLLYRKFARNISLRSSRILAKVNALIQETTSGIYVAKSFRAEEPIYDEFDEMNDASYKINLQKGIILSSIWPVITVIFNLGMAVVIYFGGLMLLGESNFIISALGSLPGDDLTIGDWFLFGLGLFLFFFPLMSVASFWSLFQQGLAASERVFGLIDAENKVLQSDNQLIESPKGKIDFDDVTFAYKEDLNVFENFNLHINGGENIAIVGHTGAGKSTIAKLISRYYEFQNGKISIDDHNIRDLNLQEYRKHLSIISQEVFLWNGSIRENLLYGVEDQDDAENRLLEVLNKVDALDWINRLEKGLDTNVGERGTLLSMGQRQLIAFARILLRNPSILIMDEATSSVDPFTEVKIQRATNLILEGRTSIIIAHRLSTVRNVDRIIVLKDGKIIEQGNHDNLLLAGGHYAELYDTYFRHQSLEYIESLTD